MMYYIYIYILYGAIILCYIYILGSMYEILYLLGDSLRFALGTTIGKFVGLFWRGIIEGLKT